MKKINKILLAASAAVTLGATYFKSQDYDSVQVHESSGIGRCIFDFDRDGKVDASFGFAGPTWPLWAEVAKGYEIRAFISHSGFRTGFTEMSEDDRERASYDLKNLDFLGKFSLIRFRALKRSVNVSCANSCLFRRPFNRICTIFKTI